MINYNTSLSFKATLLKVMKAYLLWIRPFSI